MAGRRSTEANCRWPRPWYGDTDDDVASGFRYTRAARRKCRSVHRRALRPVVAAATAAGADGLVLKRAIGDDLMPTIDALLAGQRYFDSTAAH